MEMDDYLKKVKADMRKAGEYEEFVRIVSLYIQKLERPNVKVYDDRIARFELDSDELDRANGVARRLYDSFLNPVDPTPIASPVVVEQKVRKVRAPSSSKVRAYSLDLQDADKDVLKRRADWVLDDPRVLSIGITPDYKPFILALLNGEEVMDSAMRDSGIDPGRAYRKARSILNGFLLEIKLSQPEGSVQFVSRDGSLDDFVR